MGTKRELSALVANLVSDCRTGPLLDVCAGMCSVGMAVAPSRPVWTNDVQQFAKIVADAHFCSNEGSPDAVTVSEQTRDLFELNQKKYRDEYVHNLALEDKAIKNGDHRALMFLFEEGIAAGQVAISGRPEGGFYNLFITRFAGAYFGYGQAIEIDSIRYAIDILLGKEQISADSHRWLLLALCAAMSKCTTSTGHFAQPLAPKFENRFKFISQRKRSLWLEWLAASRTLAPLGSREWRRRNRTFNKDAGTLLSELLESAPRPRVIYADPPYTKDQYSRYYHLYETAILYDYPVATGRGLYRPNRHVSAFSLRRSVDGAVDDVIAASAKMRADLIISYPTNGLMTESQLQIPKFIRSHYGRLPEIREIPHTHSTLGASKGNAKSDVTEVLYWVHAR
jgi:adenine-specific DNA-methyltransferase